MNRLLLSAGWFLSLLGPLLHCDAAMAQSPIASEGGPDSRASAQTAIQTGIATEGSVAERFELEPGFILLFDGKTLDGWEGNLNYFRIEQSAIVAGNLKDKIPNNEFLCTRRQFTDFELRLESKLIGPGQNAGIQFRSQRIANHHEMIGYQCDIGTMNADRSIWGALYDESRRRKFLVEAPIESRKHVKPQDWNKIRIVAQQRRIQIFVNDFQTVDYLEPEPSVEQSGLVGLQIHSGEPAEAWYRNIRIKAL